MTENCSAVTNTFYSTYMRACAQTPRCDASTDSQIRSIWAWFQVRDIIGKMASNYGEVSGASSVFCRPVLGKVVKGTSHTGMRETRVKTTLITSASSDVGHLKISPRKMMMDKSTIRLSVSLCVLATWGVLLSRKTLEKDT